MSDPYVISCIQQANAILGEGPVWDWRSGDLFWIDIRRMQVFRHHLATGMQTGQWVLPERLGCIALTADPERIVVTAGTRVLMLDLVTGAAEEMANPELDRPEYRFNDGAVDARGRLWLATMIDDFHAPAQFAGGRLYCLERGRPIAQVGDDYQLANGIDWSPDGSLMYLNDTVARVTYVFDYDLDRGAAANRRVLIEYPPEGGLPDGMAVDASGNIWSAMWDGGCIRQHSPEGELLQTIAMPVRRPSSLAFGGPAMDQMLVTSATTGFDSEDYRDSPLAGGLFSIRACVAGRRANLFGEVL